MANKQDFVELGKSCGHVCQALDRGLNGKSSDELSRSVLEAIGLLTEWVKPSVCTQNSLLNRVLIPEPWLRSRGRSLHEANETPFLELSTQGATKMKSSLGGGNSIGSLTSSTYDM